MQHIGDKDNPWMGNSYRYHYLRELFISYAGTYHGQYGLHVSWYHNFLDAGSTHSCGMLLLYVRLPKTSWKIDRTQGISKSMATTNLLLVSKLIRLSKNPKATGLHTD
jgi:hypothetical protein